MIWKKYKKYIIGIVIIMIIWALSIFCLVFLFKKINSKISEIQEKIISQENEKNRLAEIPKFQDQNDLIQQKESTIPALLSKDDAVTLIEKLESLATETNNQIDIQLINNVSQTVKTPSKNKDVSILGNLPSSNYLDMKIKLTGDYNSLVNFISKVENLDYYSDVVSVQVDIGDNSQPQSSVTPFSNSTNGSNNSNPPINQGGTVSSVEIVYYIQN